MATKIKIISASDFMEITPDGIINMNTSRKMLADIVRADPPPADYEMLVDFRNTQSTLSTVDLYELSAELALYRDNFRRKVALLVLPGINFDRASFFETCSHNRGFSINAYTDYETAMRWLLSMEDLPDSNVPSNKTDAGDGK